MVKPSSQMNGISLLLHSSKRLKDHTIDLLTPEEIYQFLRFELVDLNRTIKNKLVTLTPNQVLTKEVRKDLKCWEELIRENVFSLGCHRDHLPACVSHILYCILAKQQYNLAYFFVKRIESAKATLKVHLSYVSSPSAPNAPSKTPSSMAISSSSIASKLKSRTFSTSPSTNGYLNSPISPSIRVPPPPQTQESEPIEIPLTLSPITPLDIQFNTPSPPPPLFGDPIT
nr:ribosomal protein L7Ae/L30e/S12e/Gadd45 [Tanacetum cinerariifolium]